MEKWFIKNKTANFSLIARQFNISEILARLIVNRKVSSNKELEEYINPSIEHLHNPSRMKDLNKACEILLDKIKFGKKIRIVGDYDVDGVVSTYLLYTALKRCRANVDYEIPDRIKDGYGINISIIDEAYDDGVDTIITCDNGIAALEQIAHAKELGMTVIITDHHDIPFIESDSDNQRIYVVPQADAVVNPKQKDCEYPFKSLCGAAVAYKLIDVLYQEYEIPENETRQFIELVAIATVCDVMDLIDENRIFVKNGLKMINNTTQIGLKSLITETGMEEKEISVYHLGFIIGPCINASGRLASAKAGLSLLLCDNEDKAKELAVNLKSLNDERKKLTTTALESANEVIESSTVKEDKVLVVFLPDCHESLAGIIAGRVKEKYNKPTIVLTRNESGVKGSARSIEEYNMFEELNKCKDLLVKFGGHPMAAGLSLKEENIEVLRNRLNMITTLTSDDLIRRVSFDMLLPFDKIDITLIKEICKLEPYGKGNPKPTFVVKSVCITEVIVLGRDKNVLKLTVKEHSSINHTRFTAMLFQGVEEFNEYITSEFGEKELKNLYEGINNKVLLDLVFHVDINEYKGYQKIQLIIQNYRTTK